MFPRHGSFARQVHFGQGIGIAIMPAAEFGVVIAHVIAVPAKNHAAKAKALFGNGRKLVWVQKFASQNAVYIADGHLDSFRAVICRCTWHRLSIVCRKCVSRIADGEQVPGEKYFSFGAVKQRMGRDKRLFRGIHCQFSGFGSGVMLVERL